MPLPSLALPICPCLVPRIVVVRGMVYHCRPMFFSIFNPLRPSKSLTRLALPISLTPGLATLLVQALPGVCRKHKCTAQMTCPCRHTGEDAVENT